MVFQIGIVVKDIEQTIEFYEEVFGIGPFERVGKDGFGFAYVDSDRIGGTIFELIQSASKKEAGAEKDTR